MCVWGDGGGCHSGRPIIFNKGGPIVLNRRGSSGRTELRAVDAQCSVVRALRYFALDEACTECCLEVLARGFDS